MPKRRRTCVELDCRGAVWEHGLCRTHFLNTEAAERAERLRFWKPIASTYREMHYALRHHAGPASWLPCVDCGKRARDWSYEGGAPDEKCDNEGPFSADPSYYKPRCSKCHAILDHQPGRKCAA